MTQMGTELWSWTRRHRAEIADVLIVVAIVVPWVLSTLVLRGYIYWADYLSLDPSVEERLLVWLGFPVVVAGALLWRRRFPLAVLVWVTAGGLLSVGMGSYFLFPVVVMCVALYTLTIRTALPVAVGAAAGVASVLVLFGDRTMMSGNDEYQIVQSILLLGGALLAGLVARTTGLLRSSEQRGAAF